MKKIPGQLSLFAQADFLRVEIVKELGRVFGTLTMIPCPICKARGWAFVNPISGAWSWICESCQTITGSHVKD